MADNLKLMSVRLDADAVTKVEDFVLKHYYWKKNTVINGILTSVLLNASEENLLRLVGWWKSGKIRLHISVEQIE